MEQNKKILTIVLQTVHYSKWYKRNSWNWCNSSMGKWWWWGGVGGRGDMNGIMEIVPGPDY
jgi:hypothetical protein